MPKRLGLTYTANMDNIIFESKFKEGSGIDEKGKYVMAHLREVEANVILSVGPMVTNPAMVVGAKIIPIGPGKISVLEVDEEGMIGSIKPHDILATVK